jgi:hypothetical protein
MARYQVDGSFDVRRKGPPGWLIIVVFLFLLGLIGSTNEGSGDHIEPAQTSRQQ